MKIRLLSVAAWLFAACSTPAPAPVVEDAGSVSDAGDAGEVADAGPDTSTPIVDSGPPDSGPAPVDAGPPWVPPVLAARSAGCGAAGATLSTVAGIAKTTANGRTYRVVTPPGYNANTAYPVVFVFHGWYTDGTSFKSWFEFEMAGDGWTQVPAFVVYPDAIQSGEKAFRLGDDTDLKFFDDMNAALQTSYCTNPQRTFALGFSFGGKFLNHLACHRAGYVRAASIGDGSGGDRNADNRCGRLPMLATHRTTDNDELYAWGKENAAWWATKNGCSSTQAPAFDAQYKCQAYQGCTAPGSTTFCTDDEVLSGIPGYEPGWEHTVTARFRNFTWNWFNSFK